jgi:hypothetical protein
VQSHGCKILLAFKIEVFKEKSKVDDIASNQNSFDLRIQFGKKFFPNDMAFF